MIFVKTPELFDKSTVSQLARGKLDKFKGDYLIFQQSFSYKLKSEKHWKRACRRKLETLDDAQQQGLLQFFMNEEKRYNYRSSHYWQRTLDGQDRAFDWLALATESFDAGETIESAIAFSVHKWLRGRRNQLIERKIFEKIEQNIFEKGYYSADLIKNFFKKSLTERHWACWAMKGPSSHLYVPFLIDFSSDENFAVRARIYKSLGQLAHPAAIQCLQEGSFDPNSLARYEAVQALGSIADPSAVGRLIQIARKDPSERVQFAALKALHRIEGYWTYFGTWRKIFRSRTKERQAVGEMIDRGLVIFAYELLIGNPMFNRNTEILEFMDPYLIHAKKQSALNNESKELEELIRGQNGFTSNRVDNIQLVQQRLSTETSPEICLGLCQASFYELSELLSHITPLVDFPNESVRWHAKRALRKLRVAGLARRRTLTSSWVKRKGL